MSALGELPEPRSESSNAAVWDVEWLKFYQQWWPKLVALLRSISHYDTRFIEEIAQESFLDHRKYWASLDDPDRAHAYLFKIALRRTRRQQEREARCQPLPATAESDAQQHYSSVPVDVFDQVDARRQIYAAIRQLSPRRAEAVTLFYLLDLPIRDIAEIQQISESAVRAHLTSGRRDLTKLLHEDDDSEGGVS